MTSKVQFPSAEPMTFAQKTLLCYPERILQRGERGVDDREQEEHTLEITPIVCEAKIEKDCEYILSLPNGEKACLLYSEDKGPILAIKMWPGNVKTNIELDEGNYYSDAEELR